MSNPAFEKLCERLGILPGYAHAAGHPVAVPDSTRAALIRALGYDPMNAETSLARLADADWARALPPVVTVREGTPATFSVILETADEAAGLVVESEDGQRRFVAINRAAPPQARRERDGRALERRSVTLGDLPAPGYHRMWLDERPNETATLIVAPDRCYLPPDLAEGRRTWGFSVQLYGHRSATNWGIGDFTDLGRLVEQSAALGAAFVGINPLHALFPEKPDRCTPYSPNSRAMLNVLYIDVAAIPDLHEDPVAVEMVDDLTLGGRLDLLRNAPQVDYAAVTEVKRPIFERCFQSFRVRHLEAVSDRAEDFRAFVDAGGETLRRFALFEALREAHAFTGENGNWIPWHWWPAALHQPNSPDVRAFADSHADRVYFHMYLQWEADRQLSRAAERARDLPLGIYMDVAVGFDRDGAECWAHRDAVPDDIAVGCPPDLRNPLGQDWGVVPFAPTALRARAYGPFIDMLRAVMRHAKVIRIDHAFQLLRLYWVPLGKTARDGGYLSYPMDDLVNIIALESHRNRCAVVAEDLGTIPEGFRERIMGRAALSFRVLHRERGDDRSYKAPDAYPTLALAAPATHDQATLSGFWTGRDIELRDLLGLYPSPEAAAAAAEGRPEDRRHLLAALAAHVGFDDDPEGADGLPSEALILAVHRFLARTPSQMTVVQFEDLFNQTEQANMPATIDEHPNWRRRYTPEVESLDSQPIVRAIARVQAEEGRAKARNKGRPAA